MKKIVRMLIILICFCVTPFICQAKESQIIIHVGTDGEYRTITEAIEYAKEISKNCIIEISSGIYQENLILMNDTPPITFKGMGNVFLVSSENYPYSTVYCAGNYHFFNMVFLQTDERCYAGHVEYCDVSHPKQSDISFEDCLFITQRGPAFGLGAGENTYTEFKNCRFISEDEEHISLFLHNYPGANIVNQKMMFENCYFNQDILISDSAFDETLQNSKLEITFKNITVDGEIHYIPDSNKDIMLNYVPEGQDITVNIVS